MIKFLALGDSYTIGEGVAAKERWPEALAENLREGSNSIDRPHIIAKTGWTTGELLDALEQRTPEAKYDLVTLLIGVNNQYRGLPLDDYAIEFETCLSKAIQYARSNADHVCVISIPDWGISPFAIDQDQRTISQHIDAFNKVNQSLTLRQGARYVNITPLSRSLNQKEHFAADGLHPSGVAYCKWIKEILPILPSFNPKHETRNTKPIQ
ncbi:MAG: SGNH/GDSL hydrolase family protein [Rhodothermaceae bacterium]|nr:SGNH/GDSL hydrolase family protein [Rhodothermaceae bacterium]